MPKIAIDGEDLILALQRSLDSSMQYYLNSDTGAIILVNDGMIDGEDFNEDEIDELIENGPYIEIEPVDSDEAYRIMVGFVETLAGGHPRDVLNEALNGRGPFRRFKDRLYDYPDIQQQFYRFNELTYCQFALDWLEENDIDADVSFRDLIEYESPACAKNAPGESLIVEIHSAHGSNPAESHRITLRSAASGARVHLESWTDGRQTGKGVAFDLEQIPEVIQALQCAIEAAGASENT